MQPRSSPAVESLPTPLAANHLLRAPLFRVARTVRRHEGEFALEGSGGASLLLVFDVGQLLGLYVSFAILLFNMFRWGFRGVLGSARILSSDLY